MESAEVKCSACLYTLYLLNMYSIYSQLLKDDQCGGVRNGSVQMRME